MRRQCSGDLYPPRRPTWTDRAAVSHYCDPDHDGYTLCGKPIDRDVHVRSREGCKFCALESAMRRTGDGSGVVF